MAFTGNGTKLVGDDAFLQRASFGAEILGDGLTALPVGTYLIINVAGTSGFPASADGGLDPAAGDILTVETGVTITPETDDDVVTINLEDLCDISSWTMEFTKEEIETTTLCDAVKKYRAGKPDMAGTLNGIFVSGTTDDKDGFLRQFIDIVRQDGGTSFDRFVKQDEILLGQFYVNNTASLTDKMWIAAPFQTYANSLGGEIGSPQSFSGSFRFADKSYTVLSGSAAGNNVAIEPTFYRLGDGS